MRRPPNSGCLPAGLAWAAPPLLAFALAVAILPAVLLYVPTHSAVLVGLTVWTSAADARAAGLEAEAWQFGDAPLLVLRLRADPGLCRAADKNSLAFQAWITDASGARVAAGELVAKDAAVPAPAIRVGRGPFHWVALLRLADDAGALARLGETDATFSAQKIGMAGRELEVRPVIVRADALRRALAARR